MPCDAAPSWPVADAGAGGRSRAGSGGGAGAAIEDEYRYQLLIKASKRHVLRETLRKLRKYAREAKWPATAVVIDVDPLTLM